MYDKMSKLLGCIALVSSVASMPNIIIDSEGTSNVFSDHLTMVSREEWQARLPRQVERLTTPVPYVIIHHTYIPGSCNTTEQCAKYMRSMQNYHMDDQGWNDIGYNFCVGGDGKAYEGRGWTTKGSHASEANSVSIGICLIGDWRVKLPPAEQIQATKALIKIGLSMGHISQSYNILGHRQVRNTECPGDALFKEIRTWDHFSEHPTSYKEFRSYLEKKASHEPSVKGV